jgi:hypothetical protein
MGGQEISKARSEREAVDVGEVAVSDLEDFSGGKAVVARSRKGHAIYGFDGPRVSRIR